MIEQSITNDIIKGLDSLDVRYKADISLSQDGKIVFVQSNFHGLGVITKAFNIEDLKRSKLPASGLVRYHFVRELSNHCKEVY